MHGAPPTVRLYHDDSRLLAFDARVLSCDARGSAWAAVLDRTAFYPDSGGQPSDRGVLGGRAVLEVIEEGDLIVHLLDGPLAAGEAHGEVDAARRIDHTQQHTGQHILSQAFVATAGRETLSFHLGERRSTIEVSGALSPDAIGRAEEIANTIVFEDRPVRALSLTPEEAAARGARKIPERSGVLRVIEIEGFDLTPCGGTHARRTGEVGLVKTLGVEKIRGNTRLEFVCGWRALADYAFRVDVLTTLAASLTTGEAELPALVGKLREEAREARKALDEARRDLAAHGARALEASLETIGAWNVLAHLFEGPGAAVSMAESARILTEPAGRVVLFADATSGRVLFARSKEGAAPPDMGALLRKTLSETGGKGGGRPERAEGSVSRAEDGARALDAGARSLRETIGG